jgi:thiol-disulfide isomerase/thioredoxin
MFFRKLSQTGKFMPLVLIALSGALFLQTAAPVQAEEVRRFFIKNLDNKRFDTRDQKGGPFVMSFFFTTCIPCYRGMPELYAFMSKEFPDVSLLFVDPLEIDSKSDIRKFARKLNVPSELFYKDRMGIVSKRFFKGGQYVFPTIIGLRDLKYLFRYYGIDSEILAEIKNKLQER